MHATFILAPASTVATAEQLEDVIRRMTESSTNDPPAELAKLLVDLSDRCESSISIDRPADAGGAVITLHGLQPEPLNALFDATKEYRIAAYDVNLKRLYNSHGSASVRVLLGGKVVIPYATAQLLDHVVRNPKWPDPDAPFVIIDRDDPGDGEYYVQTYLNDGGSYSLEYRDGSAERHYGCETSDPGVVSDAMWSWVVGDYRRLQEMARWEFVDCDE